MAKPYKQSKPPPLELTAHKKAELSIKYGRLNELWNLKQRMETEICDLMGRANDLRRKITRLDREITDEAVRCEPTVVAETTVQKEKLNETAKLVAKILKQASEDKMGVLQQLLRAQGLDLDELEE